MALVSNSISITSGQTVTFTTTPMTVSLHTYTESEMAYAYFQGDSDIYLLHNSNHRGYIQCRKCKLNDKKDLLLDSFEAVEHHLQSHELADHKVARYTWNRLTTKMSLPADDSARFGVPNKSPRREGLLKQLEKVEPTTKADNCPNQFCVLKIHTGPHEYGEDP